MTSGFDSRIHRARRITSKGLGTFVFMPSVRTRTPTSCILSARSNRPVSETTSFSNRVLSIPETTRESMISAPAGPRVVMTCRTLIILLFALFFPQLAPELSYYDCQIWPAPQQQACSSILASHAFFGRNGRLPGYAFRAQTTRMINEILVQFFVCLDHPRHMVVFPCPARGCHPQRLPSSSISEERCHGVGETLNISRLHH